MTTNKVCKLRGSDEEMSSENSYPVFRQKRSGEMCIVWYEKELQLTHEQFLDFLDVVIDVQPITWSWYSKDDFDIDWYGKFYGREQKERLQECLLQRGFEYLPTLGD